MADAAHAVDEVRSETYVTANLLTEPTFVVFCEFCICAAKQNSHIGKHFRDGPVPSFRGLRVCMEMMEQGETSARLPFIRSISAVNLPCRVAADTTILRFRISDL